jgi:hypothetical protein
VEKIATFVKPETDINGNTVVEYSAEMTVFSLIIWIISITLIVGIIYLPFYLF